MRREAHDRKGWHDQSWEQREGGESSTKGKNDEGCVGAASAMIQKASNHRNKRYMIWRALAQRFCGHLGFSDTQRPLNGGLVRPGLSFFSESLGVHEILVRKIWFPPLPKKGPKWGKTVQISRKSSKLTLFLGGGKRNFMDKTVLRTSGRFWFLSF